MNGGFVLKGKSKVKMSAPSGRGNNNHYQGELNAMISRFGIFESIVKPGLEVMERQPQLLTIADVLRFGFAGAYNKQTRFGRNSQKDKQTSIVAVSRKIIEAEGIVRRLKNIHRKSGAIDKMTVDSRMDNSLKSKSIESEDGQKIKVDFHEDGQTPSQHYQSLIMMVGINEEIEAKFTNTGIKQTQSVVIGELCQTNIRFHQDGQTPAIIDKTACLPGYEYRKTSHNRPSGSRRLESLLIGNLFETSIQFSPDDTLVAAHIKENESDLKRNEWIVGIFEDQARAAFKVNGQVVLASSPPPSPEDIDSLKPDSGTVGGWRLF